MIFLVEKEEFGVGREGRRNDDASLVMMCDVVAAAVSSLIRGIFMLI